MGDEVIDLDRENTCIVNFQTGEKKTAKIFCSTIEDLKNEICSLFGIKDKSTISQISDVNDHPVTNDSQVKSCETFFFSNTTSTTNSVSSSQKTGGKQQKITKFPKIAKVLPIHPHG